MQPIAILCLTATTLMGGALDEVRAALKALPAQSPIQVQVTEDGWDQEGKERKPHHRQYLLDEPAPAPKQARNGKQGKGHEKAGEVLKPQVELLELLEEARLQGVWDEALDGRPARHLKLEVFPPLDDEARKHVKRMVGQMDLWVDAEGLPLRLVHLTEVDVRAMLFVSVKTQVLDTRTFVRRGDRLLLRTRMTEVTGKAMGKAFAAHEDVQVVEVPLQR